MKNISENAKKTCIFIEESEFNALINRLLPGYKVDYSLDGMSIYNDEDCVDDTLLHKKLAAHFDVGEVTSIHADDCDVIGVWIVYKGDHYDYSADMSRAEFVGRIIDTLEDYCDEHNLDIPNDEKPGDETDAHIYGSDYDTIANPIRELIGDDIDKPNFESTDCYPKDKISDAICDCLTIFANMVGLSYGTLPTPVIELSEKLMEVFETWNLIGTLYYTTGRIDTRTTFAVKANDVDDAKEKGEALLQDLNIGDVEDCVACYINIVEDKDGNVLWDT